MVIKVYISGMSGSKEVKKRQQRVTMILDSKHIPYTIIDITEPGQEAEKDFMQKNAEHNGATISDQNPRHPLPPQMFNDAEYCGDYDDFDLANEVDNLEVFLKMEAPKPATESTSEHNDITINEQTTKDKSDTKEDGDKDAARQIGGATDEEKPKLEHVEAAAMDVEDTSHHKQKKLSEGEEQSDDEIVEEKTTENYDEANSDEKIEEPMSVDEEDKVSVEDSSETAIKETAPLLEADENQEVTEEDTKLSSKETSELEAADQISVKNSEETEEVNDSVEAEEVNSKDQKSENYIPNLEKEDNEEPMILDEDSKSALPVGDEANQNIEEESAEKPTERNDETEQQSPVENEELASPIDEHEHVDGATDLQPRVETAKDPPPENDEIDPESTVIEAGDDDDDESDSDEPVSVMEVAKAVEDSEVEETHLDRPVEEETTGQDTVDSKTNSSDVHGEDDDLAEQRALLEAAAAMGEREDAEEEEVDHQAEEDVEIAEEDDVSGKLVDTDDPMLAEQEQEE
ncbi:protein Ycf2 isoform X3 [Aedes aegypti]|uniref:Uncharacterized protein n=1 Tax=Aedes aegypti TaxID=7159 RepID=A0A6I8TFI4_AEDAE|nr:protein Ycf2 isoform X3 [Aedes aegypti]